MLGILRLILFGLCRVLAGVLMPGRDLAACSSDRAQCHGAVVGGFLGRALDWYQTASRPASSWRRSASCCCCSSIVVLPRA